MRTKVKLKKQIQSCEPFIFIIFVNANTIIFLSLSGNRNTIKPLRTKETNLIFYTTKPVSGDGMAGRLDMPVDVVDGLFFLGSFGKAMAVISSLPFLGTT